MDEGSAQQLSSFRTAIFYTHPETVFFLLWGSQPPMLLLPLRTLHTPGYSMEIV